MKSNQADMELQTQARYTGDAKPKYMEPEIKYPSYADYSNEGPANPEYSANRGYKEHR